MGTFIELRCENRTNRSAGEKCWSLTSDQGTISCDTRTAVLAVLRDLEDAHKNAGWKKTKLGWVCPVCAEHPDHMQEMLADQAKQGGE